MAWLRWEATYDAHPDVEDAGWEGAVVFERVCRLCKLHGYRGALSAKYLRPAWIARQTGVPVDLIERGMAAIARVGLIVEQDDGGIEIPGWDRFQPDPGKTDRQRRWREKRAQAESKVDGGRRLQPLVDAVDGDGTSTGRDETRRVPPARARACEAADAAQTSLPGMEPDPNLKADGKPKHVRTLITERWELEFPGHHRDAEGSPVQYTGMTAHKRQEVNGLNGLVDLVEKQCGPGASPPEMCDWLFRNIIYRAWPPRDGGAPERDFWAKKSTGYAETLKLTSEIASAPVHRHRQQDNGYADVLDGPPAGSRPPRESNDE